VGDKFLRELKSNSVTFSTRVLVSMLALAEFLVSEARILERGGEQAKREVKDQIPSERIKDASAMARELRWRLKSAAGYSSDDDRPQGIRRGVNGNKRKHVELGSSELGHFKNYMPKSWDRVVEEMADDETVRMRVKAPGNDEDWKEQWGVWSKDEDGDGEEAEVRRQRGTVLKVRRTARGVERQRIERVVEEWLWES
jgi:F-box/leucine-rich repeat protein 10/11